MRRRTEGIELTGAQPSLGQAFQADCDVYTITKDVTVLDHDVADS